jgi:hypothetical protein
MTNLASRFSRASSAEESAPPSRLGATAPSRSATAQMIIDADRLRRGLVAAADVPLPRDPTARMITQFAIAIGQAPKARTDVSGLSDAARMIVNADKMRNGADFDEAV